MVTTFNNRTETNNAAIIRNTEMIQQNGREIDHLRRTDGNQAVQLGRIETSIENIESGLSRLVEVLDQERSRNGP